MSIVHRSPLQHSRITNQKSEVWNHNHEPRTAIRKSRAANQKSRTLNRKPRTVNHEPRTASVKNRTQHSTGCSTYGSPEHSSCRFIFISVFPSPFLVFFPCPLFVVSCSMFLDTLFLVAWYPAPTRSPSESAAHRSQQVADHRSQIADHRSQRACDFFLIFFDLPFTHAGDFLDWSGTRTCGRGHEGVDVSTFRSFILPTFQPDFATESEVRQTGKAGCHVRRM